MMQPYQPDFYQPQEFASEQEYQQIPEDQAHPVFWRGRRRGRFDVFFPIIIPFNPGYYPYPSYPYPYPYPYPYYPYPYPFGY
jgi:hypothetical protein